MPRPLRVEFAGAIYRLMSRGDHQEAIFRGDENRRTFVRTLGEACAKTGWQVHDHCLNQPWDDVDPMPDYENVLGD